MTFITMKTYKLLSTVIGGVSTPSSQIGDNCIGKQGCPTIAKNGKFISIIGRKLTTDQMRQFEKETGRRVAEGEALVEIPLSLMDAAGFIER